MKKEQLEQFISEGLSISKIGKITKKSFTSIRYWLHKFNLKTKSKAIRIIDVPAGMIKKCSTCSVSKELNSKNFYIKKDGRFHYSCKECRDKDSLNRQRNRKKLFVNYKGGKCIICGYNKYLGALDFHHLDPSLKDFSIQSIRHFNLETAKIELDKCVCVCSNCHREIHGDLIDITKYMVI